MISSFFMLLLGSFILGVIGTNAKAKEAMDLAGEVTFYGWIGSIIYGLIYKAIIGSSASMELTAKGVSEFAVDPVFAPTNE